MFPPEEQSWLPSLPPGLAEPAETVSYQLSAKEAHCGRCRVTLKNKECTWFRGLGAYRQKRILPKNSMLCDCYPLKSFKLDINQRYFQTFGYLFSFLDIFSWCIGTLLMACCFSLCPGRRRFELNQEKNKVFLSDMKATTSGSLSQCAGQVSVCLIADSIFQVQVLGIEQNFHSLPNSPKQEWEHWVLPSCLLALFHSCCWEWCYSVVLPDFQ